MDNTVAETDDEFQRRMLLGVSRTFALTIPELPDALFPVVANAYLLCRIADTIEDDPALDADATREFSEAFIAVVTADADPAALAAELYPRLGDETSEAELALVEQMPRVIGIMRGFSAQQQAALGECVSIMSRGMSEFSIAASRRGLADQASMDHYCYVVAGVVGECLTRLFSVYSDDIARHHDHLMALSVSFGQGLQMTNILKDIWADYERGVCWLPRQVFSAHGFDLDELGGHPDELGFQAGLMELIGVARMHLQNALDYVKLLPRGERGLRNFCLWAIGMAVLTLRRIHENPAFRSGDEVKISRKAVYATIWGSRLLASSNALLQLSFEGLCRDLPASRGSGSA